MYVPGGQLRKGPPHCGPFAFFCKALFVGHERFSLRRGRNTTALSR
jgi:hypothetical protein